MKTTHTSLRLLAAIAIVAGGTFPAATAAGQSTEKIKVLVAVPLSGQTAGFGEDQCRGAKLAASNVNKTRLINKGPHKNAKLSIECVDNEGSADATATIATRFISETDIFALSGFATSPESAAAAGVVARADLGVVSISGSGDFLSDDFDNIVINARRLDSFGQGMTDVCNSYYGATNIADLSPDAAYMPSFRAGRDAAIDEGDMTLVSEQDYPFDTSDFGPFLTRLDAAGADCVVLGAFAPQFCQIVAEARDMGLQQPFVDFITAGQGPGCAEAAGAAHEGILFGQSIPIPPKPGSRLAKASDQFEARYDAPLTTPAADGYDAVLAIAYAMRDGAKDREDLLPAMKKLNEQGIRGPLKYNNEFRVAGGTLSVLEATGPADSDVETIASYRLHDDGRGTLISVSECADRPTCLKTG